MKKKIDCWWKGSEASEAEVAEHMRSLDGFRYVFVEWIDGFNIYHSLGTNNEIAFYEMFLDAGRQLGSKAKKKSRSRFPRFFPR